MLKIKFSQLIWNLSSLKIELKKKLLSASSSALKICTNFTEELILFERLHEINKRATPIKMSRYKLSIQLFKLYNSNIPTPDWIDLNHQQNFNGRSDKVLISNVSNFKIGMNLIVNRFSSISNLIEHNWLNLSLNAYIIKCKSLFLS